MDAGICELGAAEEVPGSMLIFSYVNKEGKTIRHMQDAGSHYKTPDEIHPRVKPIMGSIDSVTLTHAHGDHIGLLLDCIDAGLNANIFATRETYLITKLQLSQQVAPLKNFEGGASQRSGKKQFKYPDMLKALSMFVDENGNRIEEDLRDKEGGRRGFSYGLEHKINAELTETFYDAGHIPGSAQVLKRIRQGGEKIDILTCYDLGRTDYHIGDKPIVDTPIINFPHTDFPKDIDYVVLEATYGNKVHKPIDESIEDLRKGIWDARQKKGLLVIPAFTIMRTHMVWNFVYDLFKSGKLPEDMRLISSSPGADQVAKIILQNLQNTDEKAHEEFMNRDDNPFNFEWMIRHKKMEETMNLIKNRGDQPNAIVAASGMMEMGRMVPIARETISDPRNIIMLTGYQSPGTRGYKILNKEPRIWFPKYKELPAGEIELKAETRKLSGLSGHADVEENIAHLKKIDPEKKLKGVFIKHGEKDACHALRQTIIDKLGYAPEKVIVMEKGKSYRMESSPVR